MSCIKTVIAIICLFFVAELHAQTNKQQLASTHIDTSLRIKKDTTIIAKDSLAKRSLTKDTTATDTFAKKKHDPAKATRRSAIIPGWGQAYNHQYWKIPIVYGALAIPAASFVYNNKWYKKTRDAYTLVINNDSAHYNEIDPKLQGLINSPESLQFYRNSFRRDRDYSILFFLIAWGVNVVDATVFGHLKDFDVSDNLTMHLQPDYNPMSKKLNLGFAFNFKTPQKKVFSSF